VSTDIIRGQIEAAWQEEARTRAFEDLVRSQLVEAGAGEVPADSSTVAEILLAWRMQLENVPDLLDALRAAAQAAGMAAAVEPVVAAALRYFSDRDDVLPDSHGVLGLLDDMYLALSLIRAVSEHHRQRSGRPLIEVDLAESIASVQPLFRGARLDALNLRIEQSLAAPEVIACLEQLSRMAQPLPLAT
jgi:uncharacterized membrane protein YkvA (DUF1232 family)